MSNRLFHLQSLLTLTASAILLVACSQEKMAMSSSSNFSTAPRVTLTAGEVAGVSEDTLNVFKGIPYAAPPVGAARWQPPAAPEPWIGTLNATDYGAPCPQPGVRYSTIYTAELAAPSEDCLKLNVWAPKDAVDAPVFFWIHGGANVRGASEEVMYDGASLAKTGAIVVTINYRLGVLGFLAHPELSAESDSGVSGNYALLDQIAALRWVQDNIREFGGDPQRVTIAGESAGGLSVLHLMSMPSARGLFSRAIAQSSYMISLPELKRARFGQPSAEDIGRDLMAKLGATSIAELRAMDSQAISNAAADIGYSPLGNVDGSFLPKQLVETFEQGEQAPVPVLVGFTSGEIRSMTMLAPPAVPAEEYEHSIRDRYLDLAEDFLRLYPSDHVQESIYAATRDALYGWTAERVARAQTKLQQPAYLYLFDHGYPATDEAGLHAFHASELPFMFGNLKHTPPLWPKIPDTAKHRRMSQAMVNYWSSFVNGESPVAEGETDWDSYGDKRVYMQFGETPTLEQQLFPGMYELHEEAVRRRREGDQPWNWNTGLWSPPLLPPQ